MAHRYRRYLIIGVAALVPLLSFAALGRTLLRQSRGPLREDVKAAGRTASFPGASPSAKSRIEANGIVEPIVPETRLTTDVAGRISAIYVNEGDDVERGTLLAEIDNAVQRAQVSRAEAELAAVGADLQRVMHGMRAQDINAILSEAVAAKARAAIAASELSRTEELVQKGSVASAELDVSRRRSEAEAAAARAAAERAVGASAGSRHEDILHAQARVNAATAALEEARGVLARSQIIAPRSGRVLRLKAHVGEYHNPAAEPLLIIGDVTRLRVRMDIDERDVGRLKVGDPAQVRASAFGERRFPGKVVEISKRMGRRTVRVDDPKDRIDVKVLEVVMELEGNPPLVPGMRVTTSVETT